MNETKPSRTQDEAEAASPIDRKRCVVVLDRAIPPGRAANAASLLALTAGQRHPELPGPPLIDAAGGIHPGLVPSGIAVLSAASAELARIRRRASEAAGMDVVDLPAQGQQTNDYEEFRRLVSQVEPEELSYLGIFLYGPRREVNRLVGSLPLLR